MVRVLVPQLHRSSPPPGPTPSARAPPRLNGKVERSHRVDDQEFYQLLDRQGISDDIHLFNDKLREWEDHYNYHRPHGALRGQTPYERLIERRELVCHRGLETLHRWQLTADLTLVYGAQYVEASRSVRTTDAASGAVRNPSDDNSSVNPRLGAIYRLSERNELYASVSRLFEPPTTFELEDDVRGSDATLDAMHGTVYEIGTRSRTSAEEDAPWYWDVSVYYAQVVGASMAIGANDAHRVEPRVSLTFNDFSFDSDPTYGDNDLPAAPTYVVRGEVLYRNVNGFYAGPTFDLVGERYVDFSNDYRVDSYGLLGIRAGWSSERWEVFGELRNLLDEGYIATVSVLNRADADARVLYPGAGLSAFVGIRWKQ